MFNAPSIETKVLTKEENNLLNIYQAVYTELATRYAPELLDDLFTATTIDIVLYRALKAGDEPLSKIVAGVSFALGHIFEEKLNFKWYQINDSLGMEYALQNEKTNDVLYPFSLVQTKVESGEVGFVKKLFFMYTERMLLFTDKK